MKASEPGLISRDLTEPSASSAQTCIEFRPEEQSHQSYLVAVRLMVPGGTSIARGGGACGWWQVHWPQLTGKRLREWCQTCMQLPPPQSCNSGVLLQYHLWRRRLVSVTMNQPPCGGCFLWLPPY